MILIPQRLFDAQGVEILLRDGNSCILHKQLDQAIIEREGYISNHVISIVLAGEQKIHSYDDDFIHVRSGEVLFIPRGMYYITDLLPQQGQFRSLLFYFDESVIHSFLAASQLTEVKREEAPNYLKLGAVPSIKAFAESFISFYQQQHIQDKNLLKLKSLELLHLLNSLVSEKKLGDFLFRISLPQRRNIKQFMEKNYHKPLKIEDFAYLTGRSLSSFRRDFRSFFDTTPQKWLKSQRMHKAKKLLDEQSLRVGDLAAKVGYENTSYFIQAFKQTFGISPKQYMKQLG